MGSLAVKVIARKKVGRGWSSMGSRDSRCLAPWRCPSPRICAGTCKHSTYRRRPEQD